jgi:hypothetical protein
MINAKQKFDLPFLEDLNGSAMRRQWGRAPEEEAPEIYRKL